MSVTPRTRSAVAATRAALTLAVLTLPSPARAQTPADASYYVGVSDAGLPAQILRAPGDLALGGASASLRIFPDVLLQASASGTPNTGAYADAGARIDYSFGIIGPAAPAVPLLVWTSLYASAGGDPTRSRGYAGAEFEIRTAIDERFVRVTCDNQPENGCGNNRFDGAISVMAAPNFLSFIRLQVGASGQAGGYGTATADPRITIDPSFANASAYTIVLSPGVANDMPAVISTAPEPATLALTASGLAGLMLASRRRRRTNA